VLLRSTGVDYTSANLPTGPAPLRLQLNFDGSAHLLPGKGRGKGGGGALLVDLATDRLVWYGCKHLPNCTVNEGEYCGLEIGLRAAKKLAPHHLCVKGDSMLVIGQLNGDLRTEAEHLQSANATCKMLFHSIASATTTHVYREKNTAADALANAAADGQNVDSWIDGEPPPLCDAVPRSHRSDTPDKATALLGICPHSTKALISKPIDWFQILRTSSLRHLFDTRNEAIKAGHQTSALSIRRRVTRDFIQQIMLRLAAGKKCGTLCLDTLLPPGTDQSNVSASSFNDIATW